MSLQYYITEGGKRTGHQYDDKSEALRFAAKYASERKSMVVVFTRDHRFVKSFDKRK